MVVLLRASIAPARSWKNIRAAIDGMQWRIDAPTQAANGQTFAAFGTNVLAPEWMDYTLSRARRHRLLGFFCVPLAHRFGRTGASHDEPVARRR
jgi:hypothetical protein